MKKIIKKVLSFMLSFAMVISIADLTAFQKIDFTITVEAAGTKPSGIGTESDPCLIGTAEELVWFRDAVNGGKNSICAKLTADIELSGICGGDIGGSEVSWTPIGIYIAPSNISSFSGKFDGNNKTISGLYINAPDNDYQGLFGYIGDAEVKNLNVSGDVTGGKYTGGVCGFSCVYSKIESCHNKCTVTGDLYAGGICGGNDHSTVSYCCNEAKVSGNSYISGICGISQAYSTIENCYNECDINGDNNAGGICGRNENNSNIRDCNNKGAVNSSSSGAGGICFYSNGVIENCCNEGTVTGGVSVGGICGNNYNGTVTGGYNKGTVNGLTYVGGVCGSANTALTEGCYNEGDVLGRDENGQNLGGYVGITI